MVSAIVLLAAGQPTTLPKLSPPTYASAEARKLMERTFRLYDRASSVQYEVNGVDGKRTVWKQGSYARERSKNVDWAFDGRSLSILDFARRRIYSGRVSRGKLTTVLKKLGTRMDSSLWQMLYHRNPIRAVLDSDLKVAIAGRIKMGGVDCVILRATGRGARISILAGATAGLVYRITADVLSSKGNTMSTSDRSFSQVKLNVRLPASTFRLNKPAGYKAGSMSTLLR